MPPRTLHEERERFFWNDNIFLGRVRKATPEDITKYTQIVQYRGPSGCPRVEADDDAAMPELYRTKPVWHYETLVSVPTKRKSVWKRMWSCVKKVNRRLGEVRKGVLL